MENKQEIENQINSELDYIMREGGPDPRQPLDEFVYQLIESSLSEHCENIDAISDEEYNELEALVKDIINTHEFLKPGERVIIP